MRWLRVATALVTALLVATEINFVVRAMLPAYVAYDRAFRLRFEDVVRRLP